MYITIAAAILSIFLVPARNSNAVRSALEARYQRARTLKAEFYERYSDGSGGVAAESGVVYFSRPGRMRWEYESPEQKLFLVDAKNAWFYVPADHTASRAKVRESSDWRTPLALLAGKTDLSKLCRRIELASPELSAGKDLDVQPTDGDAVLRCVPRGSDAEGAATPDVLLEVDREGWLTRIVIHEAGNAQTEFRFGNWEENLPIPEAKFHFQPPPGVAIVDEESLAGEVH
ncbi:MAG TPA: outer membrane lipoprotein chaperone LolA [Candidatus Acidoferrales bacterium]|nr:outer membrane lipoprotein chaperone LolA [Candidatus Acidoferrales bacterium]